jgi:3-hydroxyisobutyrate dehydrogenase/2-hydroxy-3-oxopropionate reductase
VTVAVVGLGAMGSRIAGRLLYAGYEVVVWNRTAEKAKPLIERGASLAASPADAAARAEALITMVTDPRALESVVAELAAGASDELTVIQMSTVGPAALARVASLLPEGTGLLDAPVLGSIGEAESGALTIFVGGPESLVERWTPLLSVLGQAMHVGPVGSGSAAKLVANTTLVGVIGVLGEALALGAGLGLARDVVFDVLATTALAQQAERRRPAVEAGDYPPRFALSLARKDADLIVEAAADAGVELRLTSAARTWLADAEAAGLGGQDYSALLGHLAPNGQSD